MSAPRSTPTGGRLALLIVGILIATFSMAILAGAGFLHWLNGKRDGDGYFTTASVRIAADAYAVTTEDVDIDEGFLDAVGADQVRLRVRSNTGTPVFVGVARREDVSAYLGESSRAVLSDVEFAPFDPTYTVVGTDQPPGDPTGQDFWTASATGAGTQTLAWDTGGSTWAVVLMNADGSPNVDADVSAGAKAGLVGTLAWIVTVVGLLVLALGVLLILLGLRRRRQPSAPDGSAWAA
jgi:hypothetical protein